MLGNDSFVTKNQRILALENFHEPMLTFATYNGSNVDYQKNYVTQVKFVDFVDFLNFLKKLEKL